MSLISDYVDGNIFHNFAFDIIIYYSSKYNKAIIKSNVDKNSSVQKWRFFVMKKLYGEVTYEKNPKKKNKKNYKGYDCWKFINYSPDKHMFSLYNKLSNFTMGEYILLVQRDENNRYLYENKTKLKLEDYLLSKKINVKVCNFGNMSPEEQFEVCSKSSFFIAAHGAGCTNIIFTPKNTPLIEINFRKHWYCDPVCDDHFNGKISLMNKCDGKLHHKSYFHKADYHNLCRLIDKEYIEIEAIEYQGLNCRNPISKKRIYIDGDNLISKLYSIQCYN